MRTWLLAFVLVVMAIAPVAFLVYNYQKNTVLTERPIANIQFEPEIASKMEVGARHEVRACKVLDGYRYELFLENGKWIEGHLTVAAKDEASVFVVELLNRAAPPSPSVTLLRQVGNYWIVEFQLTVDNHRANMTDLLKAKGLLY